MPIEMNPQPMMMRINSFDEKATINVASILFAMHAFAMLYFLKQSGRRRRE